MDKNPPAGVRRTARRQRNAAWGILLLILFTLGLVAGARWFVEQGIALAPTPTVTATRKIATETPTVDFRATRNAQELATQQARELATAGIDTPTPLPTETSTPTPTNTPTLASVGDGTPTPARTVIVNIPGVLLQGTNTPTSTPTQTTSVVIETPTDASTAPTQTPTTDLAPVEQTLTPTATAPVAEIPTETPFATPTSTATLQPVVSLQAFTQQTAAIYAGPSTRYTRTNEIAANTRVVMQGRNATGEWIYLCCELNIEGWTRQRLLSIRENQLPPNAPTGADPNDVRWLVERSPVATPATPIPVQTAIPNSDFPLFRRDQAAQAFVPQVILPNWSQQWTSQQLIQTFSSPAIVVQQSVIIANEDNHVYAFDRQQGNQRWRFDVGQVVTVGPAAQVTDGILDIYVVDRTGRVLALREQGNSAVQLWAASLNIPPKSAINIAGDLLFVTGQNGHVYAFNRFNGALVWEITTAGNVLQYPAVGDELLFVANQRLTAVDIYNRGETVWQSDPTLFSDASAPPIYAYPGVRALAEVYVGTNSGMVYAFDAANGRLLWSFNVGQRIDMMAVDRVRLYTVSGQIAKAVNRTTGTEEWTQDIGAPVVGSPIVGDGQIVYMTTGGTLFVRQSTNGALIAGTSTGALSVVAQPAVGAGQIFIPATNGIIYTLREDR